MKCSALGGKMIQIGQFEIYDKEHHKRPDGEYWGYWVNRLDGEGMFVKAELLERLINNFYEENF